MQRQANVKIEEIVIKSSNNQWPSDDCTMSELTRQSQNRGADMLHLPIVKGSPCTLSHHPNNTETEYNNECTSPESGFVLWWQQVWGEIRANRAQFGREWVNTASKGPCTIVQVCVRGNNFEKRVFRWHPGKIQRQWQKQFQSTVLTKPVSEKFNSIYLPVSLSLGYPGYNSGL